MADFASSLRVHLAQHKQRGILLDTNVLLLFLVASFCPKMIGGKRLEKYTQQDGQLLWQFVTKFDRILTTQHILAETSNLARQALKGAQWTAFADKLYPLFCLDSQDSMQKIPIHDGKVNPAVFTKLGFTDANIVGVLDGDFLLLSDDLDLFHESIRAQRAAINFTHMREAAGIL